ncbi:hypothetical protein Pan44_51550 [Caulifigura coniformis]|uniref:RNA polymerase sigma factor 70 region 4 type 2 domain-containing protein n=2 Tax=Caulifigura coniformis TaxID=2527983 RepID=A0A517SLT4_9PLAN|nr:hypothetical protein Pan44_51550 [Caulifigura coniformis]
MPGDLDFVSDDDWERFQRDMLRIAAPGHFIANVPASPNDTVQSAIATFLRRRRIGEKRDASANTPEAVRLVLLYRVWCKVREHRRRRTYVTNKPKKFDDLDPTGQLEDSVPGADFSAAEMEIFLKEALQQVARLPEQHQAVVRLCLDGHNSREIATKLGLSLGDVNAILARITIELSDDSAA